ncbi:restriction endonuclease subunit S [Streptomyces sp. NPDC058052]|uniref:restriction endonuclease subunit S n=1 Tax=Streptomyces sp. NPDC058052 TaxID=3346316 RepID=UPI0036E09DEE
MTAPDATEVALRWVLSLRSGTSCSDRLENGAIPIMGAAGPIGRTSKANTRSGSILIGRVGTVGAVNLAHGSCWASDNVIIATPGPTLENRYTYYLLLSARLPELASKTAQPLLTASAVAGLRFSIPSRQEQRRIVDFLDGETSRIDELTSKRSRQIELLQESTHSLITERLHRAAGQHVRIKHLSTRITSGPRGWGELTSDTGSLFLRITNIPRHGISLDLRDSLYVAAPDGAERERSRTQLDDVLVSITADIGSVALVDERGIDGNISQHVALIRPRKEICDGRWLSYALKSARSSQELGTASYGGTKAGLGLSDIADLTIPTPDLSDQRSIASEISRSLAHRDSLSAGMKAQCTLLNERRQALITAAVTGQFDVTTASGRNVTDGVTA